MVEGSDVPLKKSKRFLGRSGMPPSPTGVSNYQLLPARHAEQTEEPLLSAYIAGDPPPLRPWEVMHPTLPPEYNCYLLWSYCYAGQMVSATWKGASPQFTPEVTILRASSLKLPLPLVSVAWTWDV
jgi:hypothetical protein